MVYASNEEEEEEAENDPPRRRRVVLRRINYFEIMNNTEFVNRFRLNKKQFLEILGQIEHNISSRVMNIAIPASIKLLTALRFYATGCYLLIVADFSGISKNSAKTIVHSVSAAICDLRLKYIKLPRTEGEILRTANDNFQLSGMIRVVGAIDCVHIRIRSYGGEDAELFRNRKGFFSLNVQCLVNSRLEITDIVTRWPGSAHDSTIFENSRLKFRFDNFQFENGIISGDRGYRNHRYLIIPLANPQTPSEVLYNEAHIRTRCMVERCFGVWGRTFPVLTIGTRFTKWERTMNVVMATAILHNVIRRDKSYHKTDMQNYLNIPQVWSSPTPNDRQDLIENYFSRQGIGSDQNRRTRHTEELLAGGEDQVRSIVYEELGASSLDPLLWSSAADRLEAVSGSGPRRFK
ncbi:putative nuclease HARBI1 [Prorops nasuta]|uniref:putative nuclease HARBI1 n=1 Tax=Prorops nasuta TaxID=863751 RepID=UPI0034CD627F